MTELPGILADIAEAAGEEAALLITKAVGGIEVYIPRPENLGRAGKWLVEAVGERRAKDIAASLGGGHVLIPMGALVERGRRWEAMRKALADGKSGPQAARIAGLHARTVQRHRNGKSGKKGKSAVPDPRQGKLV